EYASDFIEFLESSEIFTEEAEDRYLLSLFHTFCTAILDAIKSKIQAAIKEKPIALAEIEQLIGEVIIMVESHANTFTQSVLLNDEKRKRLTDRYRDRQANVIKDCFEKLPISDADIEKIRTAFLAFFGSYE